MSEEQIDELKDNLQKIARQELPEKRISLVGDKEHNYDAPKILQFIDDVFADTVPAGAHRLVYTGKTNIPSKPLQDGVKGLEKVITRTTQPRALYFATSSCTPSADGGMSHKSDNFAAMHMVIFDDVGTKIDPNDIPKNLEPTYRIETSKDNYQWGYVFEEPITDMNHALAVLNTVAAAGLTDAGGKVPVKLVRLPDGINGKVNSEKQMFEVNLTEWTGTVYTPEQLLDRINYDDGSGVVTWERITRDGYDPLVKKHNTNYLPLNPHAQSTDGVIDEVLEWLYENDMVLANSGDGWADIICPWHHEHTDANAISAGYKPLGQGEDARSRAFHCFHDSCSHRDTKDFLTHVINSSDIELIPMRVSHWLPHGEYAFDVSQDKIVRISDDPQSFPYTSFKRSMSGKLMWAINGQGKTVKLNPVDAWMVSPYRITVDGLGSFPSKELIFHDDNGTWLNTTRVPDWGVGPFDQANVDVFIDFINYLIPDPTECGYVLDWLTHKMQDPTHRGTGLVMVATHQGAGRSTLANMLERLLGVSNSARTPFSDLIGSSFNYWEDKLLVTVDETRDTSSSSYEPFKTYEVLKQRVDTNNAMTTMNVKYGGIRRVLASSSFLILTNHMDAVPIPKGDRRFTVISNTDQPRNAAFFTQLNDWIKTSSWERDIFRWLVQRTTTNVTDLPIDTYGKQQMFVATVSAGGRIADLLSEYCHGAGIPVLTNRQTKDAIDAVCLQTGLEMKPAYMKKCLNEVSKPFAKLRVKLDGKVENPRILHWAISEPEVHYESGMTGEATAGIPQEFKDVARDSIDAFDMQAAIDYIVDNME